MCWGRARPTLWRPGLFAHPGVATITRDRHGRYAEGARRAAPEAIQVADRFHLVRNLRQAVERELAVHRRELRVSLSSQTPPPAKPEGEKKTHQLRVRSRVVEHRREIVELVGLGDENTNTLQASDSTSCITQGKPYGDPGPGRAGLSGPRRFR